MPVSFGGIALRLRLDEAEQATCKQLKHLLTGRLLSIVAVGRGLLGCEMPARSVEDELNALVASFIRSPGAGLPGQISGVVLTGETHGASPLRQSSDLILDGCAAIGGFDASKAFRVLTRRIADGACPLFEFTESPVPGVVCIYGGYRLPDRVLPRNVSLKIVCRFRDN